MPEGGAFVMRSLIAMAAVTGISLWDPSRPRHRLRLRSPGGTAGSTLFIDQSETPTGVHGRIGWVWVRAVTDARELKGRRQRTELVAGRP